jgi:hypothetical protein
LSNVSAWSTTAASNNASPPNGWPEGQAPSTVNDCAREVMAAIAKWYKDTQGTLVTAGSSNAYTLTTNNAHASLAAQSLIVFRADRTNTGAATLNVDGLGAKTIRVNGSAVIAGEIESGYTYACAYNSASTTYDLVGGGLSPPTVGDHEVVVTTGNGHGSTNNKIRRYTTTQSSVGSAITYADSAANGASFTINEDGLYSIYMVDNSVTTTATFGVSLNSAQLTTSIISITAANRVLYTWGTVQVPQSTSSVLKLVAGDVIRPHTDGLPDDTLAATGVFRIRKVNTL